MASSFLDRFRQLEIPEEKRRLDWSFLDENLALPEPLPLGELALSVLVNGLLLEPVDVAPAPTGNGDSVRFYGDAVALVARDPPSVAEARWLAQHQAELERQAKRFLDGIPTEILRQRVAEALEILQLNAPPASATARLPEAELLLPGPSVSGASSLFTGRLVGHARLLRVHHKLYNLLTLHEYTRIFEKAIEPDTFRALQALPATCSPEEMLAQIAASLPKIHKKARSPLRNKMECARVVFHGVTLLPVYREPAAALWDSYRKLLERQLKVGVLSRHAGR